MMRRLIIVLLLLLGVHVAAEAKSHPAKATEMVRLPGHVLPALQKAVPLEPGSIADKKARDNEPLTLTLTLKRDDQAGFDRYLRDIYDPKSKIYRHFLSQKEVAAKFGPSRKAYDEALGYLHKHGFELVEGSANRLTLTVRGTRGQAEGAFAVHVADYEIGKRRFFANTADPALPKEFAVHIGSVSGLSNLATPRPAKNLHIIFFSAVCTLTTLFNPSLYVQDPEGNFPTQTEWQAAYLRAFLKCVNSNAIAAGYGKLVNIDPPPPAWQGVDGTGQTVGLVAFDTFRVSDVQDYIALMGFPASQINRVSQVHVNGGAGPTPGPDQDEVQLDIAAVMGIAPGAQIVVYDAPFTGRGSFQAVFNAMLNGGVTIISNSWAYCENDTTQADVEGIDAILQTAAAAGISVFNASGDTGSTCLNGSPSTAAVPASSPSATAVGGTSLTLGPGFVYKSETYWDGTAGAPPTGQGGFGTSQFFSRPGYQDGQNGGPMRSVPDVVVNADPLSGLVICAKDLGGCPTGALYGGTSSAAPTWAAFAALLNQSQGSNLGLLNPRLYPLAGTDAFNDAASVGSNFAHVGLGSPNLARLHQRLTSQTPGPVDPSVSVVRSVGPGNAVLPPDAGISPRIPADGATEAHIVVRLADANGNPVDGKSVTLTPSPAGDAIIDPPVGISGVRDGAVTFKITDTAPELLTFTAAGDGIALSQTARVEFRVPPATSAGISASPTPVTANGIDATTITVTLQDALNRPTPGKEIMLNQGNGHSIITGPTPPVTDANGEIQFTATDLFNEVVTYTAVDVTDGDLPVPGNAVVTYTNSTNLCGAGAPAPVGQNGYTVTPFATGFVARPLSFGGINFGGCPGASTPGFLDQDVFFSDWPGDVIKLPATGGAATSANRLANIGLTLAWPVASQSGKLYAARASTGSGFSGVVLEIDPDTGAVLRTLFSGLKCPSSLAFDPLSGDLFFDGQCFGAGFDEARIFRIRGPDSASPTLEVYATLPATPNGKMSFAPDGTLYVVTGYTSATPTISVVSGTNSPIPGTVTTLAGVNSFFWVNVAEADANGAAQSLITLSSQGLELVDITQIPPARTVLATNLGGGEIGPDGCLYAPIQNVVYKLTDPTGGCSFLAANANPSLILTPASVSPNPAQGDSQTFTATLDNVPTPLGTPVFFTVTGANPQIKLVRADANGQAPFTYTAVFAGDDRIEASTTVNSDTLTSNRVRFTWNAGQHVTFATLNPSPTAGTLGQPVDVKASLTDISLASPAPVVGEVVHFALDGAQCVGMTNANGIASCQLVPNAVGIGTLTAAFAGTGQLVASTASIGFNVMAPAAPSNRAPNCSGVTAQPPTLWPPNHRWIPISIVGVVDPDGDPVAIAIKSIRQDEPVNGLGDGDTSPDGLVGIGNATAQVRAERSGNGNGRVYHIGFEANDGRGAACNGEVKVSVPHNQKKAAIDNGPLYDSTAR